MGKLTATDLERLERVLAWQQCRRSLDRMTDKALGELIAAQDTEALRASGITPELIAAAIGDVEDGAERDRRMGELFALDEARRDRLRDYLEVEK